MAATPIRTAIIDDHEAIRVGIGAALGAWLVAWAFGLTPGEIEPLGLPAGVMLLVRVVASFVGVLGFAVTFNTPMNAALAASVIGAVANVGRLAAVDAGWNPLLCAAAATTLIGLLAGWFSQRLATPRIILSVPAVLIMIPGAATFRALVAVINKDPLSGLSNGFTALGIVIALASGLVIARMLTDQAWLSQTPSWTHMPATHAQEVLRERATGKTSSCVRPYSWMVARTVARASEISRLRASWICCSSASRCFSNSL